MARSLVFINSCPPPTLQWTYGQSMRERGVCVCARALMQRRRGRKGKGWDVGVGEGSRERERRKREGSWKHSSTLLPGRAVLLTTSMSGTSPPTPILLPLVPGGTGWEERWEQGGILTGSGLGCWVAFLYSLRSQIMHLWSFPSYFHVKLEKEHASFLLVHYSPSSHLSDTPEYSTTASQRRTTPRMLHL